MRGRRRVLFISHVYPNGNARNTAVFNHIMIRSLAKISDVDVLAPIPWVRRNSRDTVSYQETLDGIRVVHPIYYYVPKLLRFLQGTFYFLSIWSTVGRMMRDIHYDTIFSSWLFPDGWAATKVASRYKISCFLHVIGTDVNRLTRGSLVTRLSLQAIRDSARSVCVSRSLQERLVSLGAEPEKLSTLYNGVDRSVFHPREKAEVRKALGIDTSWKIILFVGNIIREKGVHELARAFSRLCVGPRRGTTKLVMVGSGPCQEEIEELHQPLVAEKNIIFPGRLPHDRVAEWMSAADVFCLPSHSEGLPNVVCEALCTHTPVVATRVGGIPELQGNNSLLFLVEPEDVDSLAATLRGILEREVGAITIPHFPTWDEHAKELHRFFDNNYCARRQ